MIKPQIALNKILKNIKKLSSQKIEIKKTLDYVLAKDVLSPLDFPPFNKSAMDGYAISNDKHDIFEVVGEVAAGEVYNKKIASNQTVKIMTGAMVPCNAIKIIMKEHVQLIGNNKIKIIKRIERDNICLKGEDIKKGRKLFNKGQVITPLILANIAGAGFNKVDVYKKPRVGVLITGSELLNAGEKYKKGKIYNSNGPLLTSLLNKFGIEKITTKKSKDSLLILRKTFTNLLKNNDIIFLTGGVSVGDYDFVEELLKKTGCDIHFNKVAIQPGKPFTFATYKNKSIFAFPGNPVSVFTSYFLFAMPALYKMQGVNFKHIVNKCIFSGEFKRRNVERELYVPVKLNSHGVVKLIRFNGSGDLYSLPKAEGLMKIPIGKGIIKNKEFVNVYPLL